MERKFVYPFVMLFTSVCLDQRHAHTVVGIANYWYDKNSGLIDNKIFS